MKYFSVFISILCFVSTSYSQEANCFLVKKRSEVVAHVTVLTLISYGQTEPGIENWVASVKVINSIKGNFKKNDAFVIDFRTVDFYHVGKEIQFLKREEIPMPLKKDKEYVVFLQEKRGAKSGDSKVFGFVDDKVQALSFTQNLLNNLKHDIK